MLARLSYNTPRLVRTLASHAYVPLLHQRPPALTPSTASSSGPSSEATTSTPDLTPHEHDLLHSVIRVDHAGELGANWIYGGQKWASDLRGDKQTAAQVEEMWENERHHLRVMTKLVEQHRVRPTLLYPLWETMAWGLGAGTALMGKEAAMACTEAVETVIGEHYDDQLRDLKPIIERTGHPSLPLLASVVEEFRDDELEHLDTAVEEGALRAPGHALLSAIVGLGCKAAIKVVSKI
ncbi:ubiquinone biosynthesis monooxygenase Coq7 [Cryptotrichosporon argae]